LAVSGFPDRSGPLDPVGVGLPHQTLSRASGSYDLLNLGVDVRSTF